MRGNVPTGLLGAPEKEAREMGYHQRKMCRSTTNIDMTHTYNSPAGTARGHVQYYHGLSCLLSQRSLVPAFGTNRKIYFASRHVRGNALVSHGDVCVLVACLKATVAASLPQIYCRDPLLFSSSTFVPCCSWCVTVCVAQTSTVTDCAD